MTEFRIAFFADTHIGYSYSSRSTEQGVNLRVQDGYNALHEIIDSIVTEHKETPIDAVINGGDIFHYSHPTIRDIMTVQHFLRVLAREGIPFYGLAGNHDASDNRTEIAAVGVLHDPERDIHALYKPYEQYELNEGIILHSVSHHGHAGDEEPTVIPVPNKLNIFTTHGAAVDPKNATLMKCLDSPREQIIPPELVIADSIDLRLLGHYHSRYAVGGEELSTWYSGSTLRRGFSDDPGDRGWLLVTVFEDGSSTVEARNIRQRPQYDFPIIDATDLNSSEIQDKILENLAGTRQSEKEDAFDDAQAPILRQRVINASRSHRAGIDRAYIANKANHALRWQLEFMRPAEAAKDETLTSEEQDIVDKAVEEAQPTLARKTGSGTVNLEQQYLDWASSSNTLATLPKNSRERVGEEGRRLLNETRKEGEV